MRPALDKGWHIEERSTPMIDTSALPNYLKTEWADIYQQFFGGKYHFLHLYKGDTAQEIMPIHIRKTGPFTKAFTPFFTPFAGPFAIAKVARERWPEQQRVHRGRLEEFLKHLESHYTFAQLGPDMYSFELAFARKWKTVVQPHYVYQSSLGAPNWELRTTRDVRVALERGWQVKECHSMPGFADYFKHIFQKQSMPITISPQTVEAFHASVIEKHLAKALSVVDTKGEPLAYLSYIPWENEGRFFAWISCGKPGMNLAMTMLWHYVVETFSKDFSTIEWGGSITPKLALFKEQFSNGSKTASTMMYYSGSAGLALQAGSKLRQMLRYF